MSDVRIESYATVLCEKVGNCYTVNETAIA